MKTIIEYFKNACFRYLAVVFLSLLLPLQGWSLNINDHQVSPLAVKVQSRIIFLDGTPVKTDGEVLKAHLLEYPPGFWKDIEVPQKSGKPFKMKNAPAPAYTNLTAFPTAEGRKYTDIGEFKDGIFFLTLPYPGKYVIKFEGKDIVEFAATANGNGGLDVDLPEELKLPFNHIIRTEPNRIIQTINLQSGQKGSLVADDTGRFFIKDPFPLIAYYILDDQPGVSLNSFQRGQSEKVSKLRDRMLWLKPLPMPKKIKAPIHNIQTDRYVWIRSVAPRKNGKTYYFLTSYNGKNKRKSVKLLSLGREAEKGVGSTSLYLTEDGDARLVVTFQGQHGKTPPSIFSISPDLGLSPVDDPYYPLYRFKEHTISGTRWMIPTFMGIPLNEGGGNSISVECAVKYWGNKKASEEHDKAVMSVVKPFFPQCWDDNYKHGGCENLAASCNRIKECRESLPSPPPAVSGTRTASAVTSFSVVFDETTKEYFLDPENIVPDPLKELHEIYRSIDLEKCSITVNGYGPFSYSYRDIPPNIGLGCSDLVTVSEGEPQIVKTRDGKTRTIRIPTQERVFDEECLRNLQKSLDNYPVRMGFENDEGGGGYVGPGKSSVSLMDPGRRELGRLGKPINLKEGPYSSLRYIGTRVVAEYPTQKAAREKCKSPSRKSRQGGRKTVYVCKELFTLGVCPQKYSFSFTENGMQVDYDAMYGGDCSSPLNEDVEIRLRAEAKGFEPESTSWVERQNDPSGIVITGSVKDDQGVPILDATVSLPDLGTEVMTDEFGLFSLQSNADGQGDPFKGEMHFVLNRVVPDMILELSLELE